MGEPSLPPAAFDHPLRLPAMAGSGGRLGGVGPGAGEAVGLGAGLDDGGAEGEAVDDRGAEAGVGEGLGPANRKLSLDAMATLAVSSRSVRTWTSSSAPQRSSSM